MSTEHNGFGLPHARHKRATALAVCASAAALSVGTFVLVTADAKPRPPRDGLRPTRSAPRAATPGVNYVQPGWLPVGTSIIRNGTNGDVQVMTMQLPGKVNENTVPVGGAAPSDYARVHPATTFTVYVGSSSELTDQALDPSVFKSSIVTVQGVSGTLTVPVGGFGPVRLQWTVDSTKYTIVTSRLTTVDGPSGLPDSDVLHIANTLAPAPRPAARS